MLTSSSRMAMTLFRAVEDPGMSLYLLKPLFVHVSN